MPAKTSRDWRNQFIPTPSPEPCSPPNACSEKRRDGCKLPHHEGIEKEDFAHYSGEIPRNRAKRNGAARNWPPRSAAEINSYCCSARMVVSFFVVPGRVVRY